MRWLKQAGFKWLLAEKEKGKGGEDEDKGEHFTV